MEYISTTEAAQILGVSNTRVLKFIHDGRLQAEKVSNQYWAIRRDSAEALAKIIRAPGWPKGKPRK